MSGLAWRHDGGAEFDVMQLLLICSQSLLLIGKIMRERGSCSPSTSLAANK